MITVNGLPLYKNHTFPGGEVRVQINFDDPVYTHCPSFNVKAVVENSNELIAVLHTIKIIRSKKPKSNITVSLYYLPYARQDRECNPGEINGLAWIVEMLTDAGADRLVTFDLHNLFALGALSSPNFTISNINVSDFLLNNLPLIGKYKAIVSPDHGSRSKVEKIVKMANNLIYPEDFSIDREIKDLYRIDLLCYNKKRNSQTGQIIEIEMDDESVKLVNSMHNYLKDKNVLVIDDICDGGGTFLPIVDDLKSTWGAKKVDLFVSHGIFSKGFYELLPVQRRDGFDNIITTDSFFSEAKRNELVSNLSDRIKIIQIN